MAVFPRGSRTTIVPTWPQSHDVVDPLRPKYIPHTYVNSLGLTPRGELWPVRGRGVEMSCLRSASGESTEGRDR